MYIVFILTLIPILFLAYRLSGRDLMSPPVVMVGMFFLCAVFGLYRYDEWRYSTYSIETAVLLVLGIMSFVLAGTIGKYSRRRFFPDERSLDTPISRIEISGIVPILITMIGVVQIYTLYRQIQFTVIDLGYNHSTLAQTLYVYRVINMTGRIPEGYGLSGIHSLLKYFVESAAAFGIFIFLHNVVAVRSFRKKDLLWLAVISLWPLNALLTTSRGDLLNVISMAFYLVYFFLGMRKGFNQKTEMKVMKRGVQLLLVFLAVFLVVSVQQGRVSSGFVRYLSTYTNGGIRNFDLFVKDPIPFNQGVVGNDETLRYVSILLNRLGGSSVQNTLALEFREIHGVNTGNIYTAFRRYYSDFGPCGIILFSSFLGYLLTRLYYRAKGNVSTGRANFSVLLFAWLSKPIFFMAIEDSFYVSVVTLNGVIRVVFLWLMYQILVRKKIKVRFGNAR